MPVRAVVPIGGQAFVPPCICAEHPADPVVRHASFAATRAKRFSFDQVPATLNTPAATHQRSASMPHVDARPHAPAKLDTSKPGTSSRTRPSRRLHNFHLHLPLEAQARLSEWQASTEQGERSQDHGTPFSSSVPSTPQVGRAYTRVAFPHVGPGSGFESAPPSSGSRRSTRPSSRSGAGEDLAHVARADPCGSLSEGTDGTGCAHATPLATPELDSSPSSPTTTAPRTPSPAHARARSVRTFCTSSEWYIKQGAYAAQMHAHTEKMWNRERQLLEYTAAAGLVPAQPRRAGGSARPWPMTQAQQARQEVAQVKVQRALRPHKSRSPRWPKASPILRKLSPTLSPAPSGKNSTAESRAGESLSSSSRTPSARGATSAPMQSPETTKSWTRLWRKIFV